MATGRYAGYFNHKETSDVQVIIQVASSDGNLAREQLQGESDLTHPASSAELHAHSVILLGNSPVWKAELERWQDIGQPKKIKIIVEEGEQAAACKLVECLYTDCLPDIRAPEDLSQLVGILMLADQYQVEAALSMCVHKLEMMKDLGTITWELADKVMQLPAAYLEKPGLSYLLTSIQQKILRHALANTSPPGVGLDLELVLRESVLEECLMALPLPTFSRLLMDDRCRVATENTVAAAVLWRIDQHRLESDDDMDDLPVRSPDYYAIIMAEAIRVPHLSPMFAAAMPIIAPELVTFLGPSTFPIARELERLPPDFQNDLVARWAKGPDVPQSWLAGRRPLSTVTALKFDWAVSSTDVASKFNARKTILACSPKHFFAGMHWIALLQPKAIRDEGLYRVNLRVTAFYPLLTKGPYVGARVSAKILAPGQKSAVHREGPMMMPAGVGRGWDDMFGPPMKKWDQSLMQQWTNSNGDITIRVKISDVV